MIKVLIVEDNELNQVVLQEMLSIIFSDLDITCKDGAIETLEMTDLSSYQLILSDIDMPKMDGFELYTELRNTRQIKAPIIAITALAVQGDRDRMLLHGFDAYVSKPIDMGDLETILTPYINELS